MGPEVVEAQRPEPDNKDNAEDGVGDAQKMAGSGYLLLVLFTLAFFYWLFKPYKNSNECAQL